MKTGEDPDLRELLDQGRVEIVGPVDAVRKDENPSSRLEQAVTYGLVSIVVLLLASLVTVVLQTLGVIQTGFVSNLSVLSTETEVLKIMGIGLGGVVLMLQALIANKRARAMETNAMAQAQAALEQARANYNAEAGLRQERLKNAIDHLGNTSESVRLGGAFELFHLAEEAKTLRRTVLDILCSHIRRTTRGDEYPQDHPDQPSEEIQSLLTLLFVQEHRAFAGLRANLYKSWLNGADLSGAQLRGADLRGVSLNHALLRQAHLESANLMEAHLREVELSGAHLREAYLLNAHLQGANLNSAQLQGADITGGRLTFARLDDASLRGADLASTEMVGASLRSARLQGARLYLTNLSSAVLYHAEFHGVRGGSGFPSSFGYDHRSGFDQRIWSSIGRQSDTACITVGGLRAERIEELVNELLVQEKRDELELMLRAQVDQPARTGLPKQMGAYTGSYSEEDALDWISEQDSTMGRADPKKRAEWVEEQKRRAQISREYRERFV